MSDLDYLISCTELAARLGDTSLRIIDCRASLAAVDAGLLAWQQSHIPGACHAHLESALSGPVTVGHTGRHPLPSRTALDALFSQWGLTHASEVIIYDASGGAFAARAWWLLRWAGVHRARILDGGFPAWLNAGHPVTAEVPTGVAKTDFHGTCETHWLITAEQLRASLQDPALHLLDARAHPRYRGEVEPIDPVAGHIPGAVCEPYEALVDAEGKFLTPDRLREHLAAHHARQSTVYCGSGVTACHLLFNLARAGHPWPRLYAGSWSEWITDPARPVERG